MSDQMMFLFPGVGSHHTGMGKTFYEQFQGARDLFTEASDVLHCDMQRLCFSPEAASELDKLEHAQTALLCVSVAAYRAMVEETGLKQGFYLGYSLGEYSALCCAGALEFKDALLLVRDRGRIVTEVASAGEGSMFWIVNIAAERVERICEELRQDQEAVFISAYDSPVKTSISGTHTALRKAGERVVAAGGIPIPIKMSGPFHSPLMQPAADRFRDLLNTYTYKTPDMSVFSNFTARLYTAAEDIPRNLTLQLVNPIRWKASLQQAFAWGVSTSIEIGPKNVLTYLLEKNMPGVEAQVLETAQALQILKKNFPPFDYVKFMSKCLTTIVGTKNSNNDMQAYEEKVVGAFKKLQALYEDILAGTVIPDTSLSQTALSLVTEALLTKGISATEVASRVARLSQ